LRPDTIHGEERTEPHPLKGDAMASFNKILLMGNLTRDPQLSYLPSNTPVVEIGIATNHRYKKQDGTQADDVMFIDCRAFGRTAEVINQYFQKGKPIFIEGRLQLDQWTDKEGQKRSKHRVFIDNFQFVGDGPGGGGGERAGGGARPAARGAPRQASHEDGPPPPSDADAMVSDDIPF
jgi:single-strand DNA-binding protein